MKGVRINASRGLDGLDLLDLPDPGAPGPGEIRVRVHASSLNYHDYGVARSGDPKFQGRIPLSDGAGVVEAVGEGVTEFEVGDSVVSCFFPLWLDGPATTGDFSTVPGDGVDGCRSVASMRPGNDRFARRSDSRLLHRRRHRRGSGRRRSTGRTDLTWR